MSDRHTDLIAKLYQQYCDAYVAHRLQFYVREPRPKNHWQRFYVTFQEQIVQETLHCNKEGEADQVYEFLARKTYEKIDKKLKFRKMNDQ